MNRYEAHQNLVKEFSNALSEKFPDIIVIPYTVGMFRAFDNPDRIIRAGIKGVPDLIIFGKGFYLFLDAKTGNATFNKNQRFFKERMQEVAGCDIVFKLKSVDQGLKIIKGFYEQ
jgi:hypothetical protein